MATAAEIVELDGDELETRLNETRRELFNLRFQLATGQLDNFSRMNHVRKDIARLLTELRAREIAEAEGLAVEDIPVHQAVARQQAEDKALGRTRVPAAERRAAERAEENKDVEKNDVEKDDAQENKDVEAKAKAKADVEDEDVEAKADVEDEDAGNHGAEDEDTDDAEAEDTDGVETTTTVTASAAPVAATDDDVEEEG
jgi:large subunit ribosomal protein L29